MQPEIHAAWRAGVSRVTRTVALSAIDTTRRPLFRSATNVSGITAQQQRPIERAKRKDRGSHSSASDGGGVARTYGA